MLRVKAARDRWTSPYQKNPFDIAIAEKLELLLDSGREIKKNKDVFGAGGSLSCRSEDKYFASSEGSSIQQLIIQSFGLLSANAVDVASRKSKSRTFEPSPRSAGFEIVPEMNLKENAQRIREEVIEHLKAPAVKPGKYDLILMPTHLSLTIHESLGHSTELDRALGYEANYAGTSFLTTDKLGKFRVGSDIVNVYGDRTTEHGLSTVAYDDDGVRQRVSTSFETASSSGIRRFGTRRHSSVKRNRAAAAMRTRGPAYRSSGCRTSRLHPAVRKRHSRI